MAFEQLTNHIKGVSDNTQSFVKNNAEYYKLVAFKHGMKALIGVATLTIRGIFGLIFLMFLSVGVALLIGERMESASTGFFIVGSFYFLIFILIVAFAKKPLEQFLLEKYSKVAFADDMEGDINEAIVAKRIADESI